MLAVDKSAAVETVSRATITGNIAPRPARVGGFGRSVVGARLNAGGGWMSRGNASGCLPRQTPGHLAEIRLRVRGHGASDLLRLRSPRVPAIGAVVF
jgi:hypothetical protein